MQRGDMLHCKNARDRDITPIHIINRGISVPFQSFIPYHVPEACIPVFYPVCRRSAALLHDRRQGVFVSDIAADVIDSNPSSKRRRAPRSPLSPLALAVGSFGIGTGEFVIMGLLPEVADTFGVTTPEAGHVISAYALGVVVGAPIIAVLAAKMARRTLLLLMMAIFAAGNISERDGPTFESLRSSAFHHRPAARRLFRRRSACGRLHGARPSPRACCRPSHARPHYCHPHRHADRDLPRPGF